MPRFATLPFTLRRSTDEFTMLGMTTTTEKVHGLLRLEGEEVTVQWRLNRTTDHLGGAKYHTDEEIEPVREVTIPLSALHDGDSFLGTRFAVAVTPGLSLVDPQRLDRENATLLLGPVKWISRGKIRTKRGYAPVAK